MNRFEVHKIPSVLKELRPNSRVLGIDFNAWLQHNFSTLEILYQLKLQGSQVFYMQDVPTVLPIYGKPYFGKFGLINDYELNLAGIERIILNEEKKTTLIDESHLLEAVRKISVAQNFEDLKRLNLSHFNVGYPITSTIASEFRNSEISLKAMRKRAKWYLYEYARVVNFTNNLVQTHNLDALVVFNGRFVRENAAAEAARSLGLTIFYHESVEPVTYSVSKHKPHCTAGAYEDFLALSVGLSKEQIVETGSRWFNTRIQGKSKAANRFHTNWMSGTGDLFAGLRGKKVTIFPTSDEEFLGLSSEWDLPTGLSQFDWLKEITINLIQEEANVIIRLHPNLQKKSKSLRRKWMQLAELDSVKVVTPTSTINSYELVQNSDLVITCGSTIATEAAFLDIPVLSVGMAIYDKFSIISRKTTMESIIEAFRMKNFSDLKLGYIHTHKYGFYEEARKHYRVHFIESKSYLFDENRNPNIFNRIFARMYLQTKIFISQV